MSAPSQSSSQRSVLTPLWAIALFLSVTETVLGIGVIQTSGGIQIALTIFVLSLPLLIAGTFFFMLWKRPWVFYDPPIESHKGTDVAENILNGAATKAQEDTRRQPFLTIDSRLFEKGGKGRIWQVPYHRYTGISNLLDDIYNTLNERDSSFPSYAFGKSWVLRDGESGCIFKDMGRSWVDRQGKGPGLDERGLLEVGFKPGMTLECVWLPN